MDGVRLKEAGEKELIISFEGRISRDNAKDTEEALIKLRQENRQEQLIFDFNELKYISSAGLRVVLLAHKLMLPTGGKMIIRQPYAFCKQVLEATGMDSILTVE